MKFSIASKLGLMTTFLVLASVGVVGGLFYGKTTAFLVEHALDDIAGEVHDAGNILQSIVRTDDEDVLILANTPPIQGMLRARSAGGIDKQDTTSYLQWISRLETIFESYLQHKSRYVKIRVIDEQGQELVNLVRKGSTIVPLKGDELQNKAHRPYVRETLKLPIGAVYISEFNLNREHGEVSKPNREVVRIATPIFDEKTAMRAGLVIITAEISDELRVIQQSVVSKSKSKIYITNDRGDYLLHPDQSKTYGFDLGKRYRIQEDIPKLTKLYLPENQDQQITLLPEEDDDWHVINFTKIPIDVSHPERYIAVIMTQDYASIISEQSEVLNDVTLWAILLALAGTALAVIFSIQITRPIKQMTLAVDDFGHQRLTTASLPVTSADEIGILARSFESMTRQVRESQANLRELNDSLEAQIVERTRSLEESETHHRTILEAIADAVITIDVDGIITSFNPAAESIFGYLKLNVRHIMLI